MTQFLADADLTIYARDVCGERLTSAGAPCIRPVGHTGLHVPATNRDAPDYVRRDWVIGEVRRLRDQREGGDALYGAVAE